MGSVTATVVRRTGVKFILEFRTFAAFTRSGFRRNSTYRQATLAGAFTNVVFGFLRCYVLLAAVDAAGRRIGDYDPRQLATYVWAGQGLLAVVQLWGWTELADRIRSGEVASDLLRPVNLVLSCLFTDLGRAAYAMATRFLPPVLTGPLFFELWLPRHWSTWPLFVISVTLAVMVSFGCRYLVNATVYWLHDGRGPLVLWSIGSGVLGGLYFPLRFLPDWAYPGLWLATPFPSLMQTPLDLLAEVDRLPTRLGLVGVQAGWAALLLLACLVTQQRAERRMVVQGG